jgi:membrane-bound lytic murein transglycosylase B
MQQKLTDLGFDTKGVDGRIGPNSRRAIRAWQAANGLTADGYMEQRLFKRLMAQ